MRSIRLTLLIFALGPAAFCPASARASNGGAAIAVLSPGLRAPLCVIAEPDSGALVVFEDLRNPQLGLYVQRVDRRGRPTLAPGGVLVLDVTPDIGVSTSMVPDGSGGCVIAWSHNRGATGMDILVQHVLANGTLGYGSSGLLVCNATRDQIYPSLVAGPSGYYYVVWADARANVGPYDGAYDTYAQRLSFAGVAQWAANGLMINSVAHRGSSLESPTSDMTGGLIVGWTDDVFSLRAQRVNSAGSPLWTADGVVLGGSNDQAVAFAPDGAGGAFAAWNHSDCSSGCTYAPFAQHIQAAGTLALAAGGVPVLPTTSDVFTVTPVRNASGGCFFYVLSLPSIGTRQFYRQEIDAAGNLLRGTYGEYMASIVSEVEVVDVGNAVVVTTTPLTATTPRTKLQVQRYALDGTPLLPNGGVIASRDEPNLSILDAQIVGMAGGITMVAYADLRYGRPTDDQNYQTFGQAFDATGKPLWDDAEQPTFVSVQDARGDQGGFVRANWNSSAADQPGVGVATDYRVWRSVPPGTAAQFATLRPKADGVFRVGNRTLLVRANTYWEMVGDAPAAQLASYALTVPTAQDSMAGSSADESFMVEALDDSSHHWFSGTLTAHSVDNLAPGAISSATGYYSSGTTTLYWGGNGATDLCCYDVFRGTSAGFTPSSANRIGTTTNVTFADPAGSPLWYRIAARDIHGNLGPSALVLPNGALDAGGPEPPHVWALHSTWQRGDRVLALAVDVPQADHGRIELFDVAGRRLWSQTFHTTAPQSLSMRVTGHDVALAPGLVLVRLRAESGRTLVARALVLR